MAALHLELGLVGLVKVGWLFFVDAYQPSSHLIDFYSWI